jgi:polar amino acid transport system substrate-binding protein
MKKLLISSSLAALLAFGVSAVQAQGAEGGVAPEGADTLERSKVRGKLLACADPWNYPYSVQGGNPPGIDVEVIREIAKRGGMEVDVYWSDTSTRGGIGRAFRGSILRDRCDVFVGISDSGDEDMLSARGRAGRLVFTEPYLGLGYVLLVQNSAVGKKSLEELKAANIRVGVQMKTPIDDYMFRNQISRELYMDNRRVMRGLAQGEIDAAIVSISALAVAKREFPDAKFSMVPDYVPESDQRWDLNMVVRTKDESLKQFINQGIAELLRDGTIKRIVEKYEMPFYPPFSS